MTLVYLHGFNSDGGGWKAAALAKHFPEAQVLSPDLPADPSLVVALLLELLESVPRPVYLVGTSLGGFYAYYLSAHFGWPALLFNPSLQPHLTLHRGIGHWQTFVKGRDYHFTADYLDTLAHLKTEADRRVVAGQLYFFLATDDEVLDLSGIPAAFPGAGAIRWYPRCGHSFDKFERALKEIRQAGWLES